MVDRRKRKRKSKIKNKKNNGEEYNEDRIGVLKEKEMQREKTTSFESRVKRMQSERFYTIRQPEWAVYYSEEIQIVFFVCFAASFIYDAKFNALGPTNGRVISLIDTFNSVAGYRSGLPKRAKIGGVTRFLSVLIGSFISKFASGAVISFLLDTTPVFFKSSRHIYSFLLGFVLVWFSPGDFMFRNIKHSEAVRLLVSISCALYKLRKALFAVEEAIKLGRSFQLGLCLVIIVLDGNTVARLMLHWMERSRSRTFDTRMHFVTDACWSVWIGVKHVILSFFVPDLAATMTLWYIERWFFDWHIEIRIAVLLFFAWRQKTFDILNQIHQMTKAANTNPPFVFPELLGCKME